MRYPDNFPQLEPIPDPLNLEGSPIHEDEQGNVIISMQTDHAPDHFDHQYDHYSNLADGIIEPFVLSNIMQDLDMAIQSDINSRKPWMDSITDGLKYQGLNIEKRERPFEGASGVFSSAQMQATLTTSSTIISETLPSSGPAKQNVVGVPSEHKERASEKQEAFFNTYFTRINKSFYPDFEEAITMNYVPMGGVPFKLYRNKGDRWPSIFYIKPQDFIVNTSATSLHMADRITHVITLTQRELILRQMSGLYKKTDKLNPTTADSSTAKSEYEQQTDKLRGITNIPKEYNPNYVLHEVHVYLDLGKYDDAFKDETHLPKPYIVTYDKNTKTCLGFYNNWHEGDSEFKRKNSFVNATFIPGFGIYGVGFYHLLTGNAMAATALQRQMIDLATVSNFPGGLRKKGVKYVNSEILAGPGDFIEVDTGVVSLDDAFKPWPYPQPSPVLKELKDDLEEDMMNLAGASMASITEIPANTPGMTVLAVLDKQEVIHSLISQRVHRALTEMFEILYELFQECLEENPYFFTHNGKEYDISKADFLEGISVIPVSDPKLSSFPKRAMTAETMKNTASEFPDYHNTYAVLKRYYSVMNVTNIDEFLVDPNAQQPPQPKDPVTENGDALKGDPLKAFMPQDHQSHIAVHSGPMNDPNTPPDAIAALQAHTREHQAMDYIITMFQQLGMPAPEDPSQIPPEAQNQIAFMAAQIVSQQQQQAVQEAPLTPEQVLMEEVKVKDKQVDLEAENNRMKIELEKTKLELETVKLEQKKEFDDKRLQIDEFKIIKEAETQEQKIELESYKAHLKMHDDNEKAKTEEIRNILPGGREDE